MKKTTLFLAGIALVAFSFTSCKGDYTCDCQYSYDGINSEDFNFELVDMTQADAEDYCADYATQWESYDYFECSLY